MFTFLCSVEVGHFLVLVLDEVQADSDSDFVLHYPEYYVHQVNFYCVLINLRLVTIQVVSRGGKRSGCLEPCGHSVCVNWIRGRE